jgi:hypothetical protein
MTTLTKQEQQILELRRSFRLGFDKASARHYDENGFLHVEGCNISKATVNPYLGAEIPGWEQLALDPKKIYYILRPPAELEKAAATSNMIPLMDAHIEVSAFDLENPDISKHQVGNTGQAGVFKNPYLINDLVIQKQGAIEGVNSKEVCELSCAYRYDVMMTPGEFEGVKYDGYMTNIRFNHVALVEEGRAGPDVMVKDSAEAMKQQRRQLMDAIREAASPNPLPVQIRTAMGPDPIRVALGMDIVSKQPGHKDSKGKSAPIVIKSERTGKTIWSGKTKKAAGKAMARIEGHKADCGMSVTQDIEKREDVSPKAGKSKYGDVKFADMKNKKYPLDNKAHVKAAASYFGMAKNRSQYSQEDQRVISGRIDAAERRFKIGKYAKSK